MFVEEMRVVIEFLSSDRFLLLVVLFFLYRIIRGAWG